MKTKLLTVALLIFCFALQAQTNVSGGIYANTTWYKANSPYIVTDTVVVFPGVTLTIEPGVVVKFDDDMRLEMRQSKLVALGTSTDTITFTSNSGSPLPGSWGEIYLNLNGGTKSRFNYCHFQYANMAFKIHSNVGQDTAAFITNSNFSRNVTGISSSVIFFTINSCLFKNNNVAINSGDGFAMANSVISNNQIGVASNAYATLTNCVIDSNILGIRLNTRNDVSNCTITNSMIGITDSVYNNFSGDENTITQNVIENNTTGILIQGVMEQITCNRICNNALYNLRYNVAFGSNGLYPNNYWCTTDSAIISSKIYDGYDNINFGLVNFMPLDSSQCYANNCRAYFSLYPDTSTPHYYIAINMASGSGSLTYIWDWGDGSSDTAAYPSHTYASAGLYNICLIVADTTGCSDTFCNNYYLMRTTNTLVYVNVVPPTSTGIKEQEENKSIVVSPNPSTGNWQLQVGSNLLGGTAEVFDASGRVVFKSLIVNRQSLIGADVPKGVYLLRVSSSKGSAVRKLVRM